MSINELSSEELFEMAKQKQELEKAVEQAKVKEKVEELKAKRREVVNQMSKEVHVIDTEIRKLTGKSGKKSSDRTPGVSAKIIEIIGAKGEISTKDIGMELKNAGMQPKNLSQTMSYLKRRGNVVSVGYGLYSLPSA